MTTKRKKYNNMLILLIVGLGFLLLVTGRLGQNSNSFPLLPTEAQVQSLVFAKQIIEREEGQWLSQPELPEAEVEQIVSAWRGAQMIPISTPVPLPPQPIIVDVYLVDGSYPQTALLYPHIAAIKIHGQEQWWRLVNQQMEMLLPQGE